MRLHLVDCNKSIVRAWADAFAAYPEVTVQEGDILAVAVHCVVSPANSLGAMDGGIDRNYCAFFGAKIEQEVQDAIARRPEGYLPVGASLVVRTGNSRIPYLIVAPTMMAPEIVERGHCYRAMRAVLRIAGSDSEVGQDVYSPGLGTGVGRVSPIEAATEMANAYHDWIRTIR